MPRLIISVGWNVPNFNGFNLEWMADVSKRGDLPQELGEICPVVLHGLNDHLQKINEAFVRLQICADPPLMMRGHISNHYRMPPESELRAGDLLLQIDRDPMHAAVFGKLWSLEPKNSAASKLVLRIPLDAASQG